MQEAINGTQRRNMSTSLHRKKKWGSNRTPTMSRPMMNCLQRKNVIKMRTLQTRRNPRTLAKVKIIRKEKELGKQAHPPLWIGAKRTQICKQAKQARKRILQIRGIFYKRLYKSHRRRKICGISAWLHEFDQECSAGWRCMYLLSNNPWI